MPQRNFQVETEILGKCIMPKEYNAFSVSLRWVADSTNFP